MNKTILVAALAVTPLIFTACGDPPVEATPTTVKPTVEYRDRRVNVPVEVASAACLEALDIAEETFGVFAEISEAAADGFYAAADFDVDGIGAARRDIQAGTADIERITPRWQAARDDCRAAS